MSTTDRVFQLHQLLRSGRPVSLKQIMERLEISRATARRDIDLLRDQLGAPIVYRSTDNGYTYDPAAEEFELPGLWFNQSELYALLAMEQLLEAVEPGLLTPHIGPLKQRIRGLLKQGVPAEGIGKRIQLQPAAHRPMPLSCFGDIAGAVLSGHQLTIQYHSRSSGKTSTRRIHPQRLVHYRDNWYLFAYCEAAQELRIFSLDRIRQLAPSDERSTRLQDTEVDRHAHASFGIFTGEATAWAVLRFTRRRAEWVADEHWHPDQIGQWKDDGYELQVPYSDPTEILMDILKYGPDVEVLAPKELRQQAARQLSTAADIYQ